MIREAGQYAVLPAAADGRRKVVLWPLNEGSFPNNVTCSVRKVGFNINGKSYVHLVGFKLRRYSGSTDDLRAGSAILNLTHHNTATLPAGTTLG